MPTLLTLPDQRAYFSKTYYNVKDNTYTTTISAGYIHYQARDGTYKDIDTLRAQPTCGLLEAALIKLRMGFTESALPARLRKQEVTTLTKSFPSRSSQSSATLASHRRRPHSSVGKF